MRPSNLLGVLVALFLGCSPQGNIVGDDDMSDDDAADDDTAMPDDDTAMPDDDVADDDDMGPCESGICELTVIAAAAECDMLPEPDPLPPQGVLVVSPAPHQITVMHFDHSEGCCPEIYVMGLAYMNDQSIEVEVDLFDDFCDCICTLDVQYALGDVPPGLWTVFGQQVEVE